MSGSSTSDEEELVLTPAELRQAVQTAELHLLPEKSRVKYMKALDLFNEWRHKKGAKTFSETVLLSYFLELANSKKPSTLWSTFSMLKSTLKIKKNVHIETYSKLMAFLKKTSAGHKPKKSKIFTALDVERFLNEAPDLDYLAAKVVLILGITGACRTQELTYLKTNNIEEHSDTLLLFELPDTKTNIERNFVVRNEYVQIIKKYQNLRPSNTATDRYFLSYRKGKCVRQPMGPNKIGSLPRDIATFLKLTSPEQYTGHCFRRTSATLLADLGADLTTLKRHGGWRSSTVAEGYLEDSIENKSKIYKGIMSSITLNKSRTDPSDRPSTSKDALIPSYFEDPWTCPSNAKDFKGQFQSAAASIPVAHSPTFTVEYKENDDNLASKSTQVTNNTISLPKKNITINLSNCNVTFNC